jgi:tetratricopeptide (TPR) repeat protein
VGRGLPAKAEALLAGPLGDQRSPEAHLLRGIILNTRSEWQAAVREIETALNSNPKLPSARAHLEHSLLLLGRNDRTEAAFRSALEQDPEDFHANVYLGWIYLRDQRHADAAAPLAAAVRTKPGHPGLLYLLAQVRHASGDLTESAALLERAVESAPDFTPAHVLLARVYGKLNRKEDYLRHRDIIAELNAAEQERNLRSQESYGEKESGALAGLALPAGSVSK